MNHLVEQTQNEILSFLREEMEPLQLQKWQKHYQDCLQCQRHLDQSEESQKLLQEAEKQEIHFWEQKQPFPSSPFQPLDWESLQEEEEVKDPRILFRLKKQDSVFLERRLSAKAAGVSEETFPAILLSESFLNERNISLVFERDPIDLSLNVGFQGGSAKIRLLMKMIIAYNDGSSESFDGQEIAIGGMWYVHPEKVKMIQQIDLIYQN